MFLKFRYHSSKLFAIVLFLILFSSSLIAQNKARSEIKIPNIPGYITLKCDFHIHTVFSDGEVWPPVRVEEAWREGLDAIALTEHIEEQHQRDAVTKDNNLSYELAKNSARSMGMILIQAVETTRDFPEGHYNSMFVTDGNKINIEDIKENLNEAAKQNAFIFWNHPGWTRPNIIPVWENIQEELYNEGIIKGIEVVNQYEYYPLALKWALEKKLTILANSDVHSPITMEWDIENGHRPMTLVFAKEPTSESIREALEERRTAGYFNDLLIGEEKFLKPIFVASIKVKNPKITLNGKSSVNVQINNSSQIPFELELAGTPEDVNVPEKIVLQPEKTVLFRVSCKFEDKTGNTRISIPYKIKNLHTGMDEFLDINILLDVTYVPADK